jgi:hypothetical protein
MKCKLMIAATIFSAAFAAPAFAQQAAVTWNTWAPGICFQYYVNADCNIEGYSLFLNRPDTIILGNGADSYRAPKHVSVRSKSRH